jgi:hypothetical protein
MNGHMRRVLLCAIVALSGLAAKPAEATTRKFCAKWGYSFEDQGLGEDYLLHSKEYMGVHYGEIIARRAVAVVYRNGTNIWSGNLDSAGCTASVTGTSGTFKFRHFDGIGGA